jgi:hypothetical protein
MTFRANYNFFRMAWVRFSLIPPDIGVYVRVEIKETRKFGQKSLRKKWNWIKKNQFMYCDEIVTMKSYQFSYT